MKLDPETLAFCYELRCEYNWSYKRIARFVGVNADHLAQRIREKVNG